MNIARPRLALLATGAAAALPLGLAFAAEWWGGLVPCALCLVERWPYRVAIAICLLGLLLPQRFARAGLALALLAVLAGGVAATVHVGVEYLWWPSPLPECAAPKFESGSISQRLRSMPARPAKPCDEPIYLIEAIPVSFAQLNWIYALALSAGIASLLARKEIRA